ncbi:hypothetical protein QFC19_001801 [Naganishia cerealis]|uniref:Uncharacterized protein n=1 Tax=Naganishia cerealis TaxID=610337 RepID=A0ACC2WG49_9TREE|nr:hypothetical protein QFC19_001801 [Naganishia cerealis]
MSRKASILAIDTSSPLSRFSSLPPQSGTPQSQHPLALELHSLRSSLAKFQHVAHKTSMQLQGKAMEVVMAQDEAGRLRDENRVLKEEVEVLRKNDYVHEEHLSPITSSQRYSHNALSELTLAHRRLSSKLDITEDALHQTNTTVSQLQMENERLLLEGKENDVLGGKWRARIAEGRAEVEKEKLERRKVEEELRICKLALEEYQKSASATDTPQSEADERQATITSPQNPTGDPPIAQICPSCTSSFMPLQPISSADSALPDTIHTTHLSSIPSNILLGIRGLHRLFHEFQDALTAKEQDIARLEAELEEKAVNVLANDEAVRGALREKERMRRELDAVRADDESASKVVERYMAFSQKTAQHLHSNFQSQTTRLNQTISTLRHQLLSTQTLLDREVARTAQLRSAIDELAEGFERETFGRRREVALRLKSLEREEKREEEGRQWAERVRRERSRLGGVADAGGTLSVNGRSVGMSRSTSPFVSPSKGKNSNLFLHPSTSATSLVSMHSSATLNPYEENQHLSTLWDLLESGIELFAGQEDQGPSSLLHLHPGSRDHHHDATLEDNSARVILAQEMTMSLMEELERTNRKLVALERKRLEWIATTTTTADGDTDDTTAVKAKAEPVQASPSERSLPLLPADVEKDVARGEASPADDVDLHPAPKGLQLDLTGQGEPCKDLADGQLPDDDTTVVLFQRLQNVTGRFSTIQKQLSDCAASTSNLRSSNGTISPAYASTLQILLDGISDVVEDVRVEVEIAIADDERDLKGYETVLKLNPDSKTITKANDFAEPGYVSAKSESFAKRLRNVEHDLVAIKVALSDLQAEEPKLNQEPGGMDEDIVNPLLGLSLRTVRAPVPPSRATMQHRQLGNGMKRGFFGSLGRTLSGTTPASLSQASSVSRHSPFSGLNGTQISPSEDEFNTPVGLNAAAEENVGEMDDVE